MVLIRSAAVVNVVVGAVVGAGIIGVAPLVAGPSATRAPEIRLTADDTTDIVIDFVRHAETTDPSPTAHQGLPGFPLSTLGEQQAQEVGQDMVTQFGGPDGVAGIYGGQNQRMVETADPFVQHEDMTFHPLSGFNEIGSGIFSDDPSGSPGIIGLLIAPVLWVLGDRLVPDLGSNDYIGTQFEENFGGAIDTMYQQTVTDVADPVVSANGHITDAVFSGEGAIAAWVLMNVNNPDLAILLPDVVKAASTETLLAHVSQVEVEGNPTDGWTLLSWAGQEMPQNPGLLTELFVDVRDLVTPPQQAAWDVFEALLTGDSTAVDGAVQTGLHNIGDALAQFPGSVADDIIDEVKTLSTDVAGGESFSDAFDSAILGMV